MLKIKIAEDGKRKLIVKGNKEIERVLNLLEKDGDVIKLDELKTDLYSNTFACKCGARIYITENYCSGCGKRIDKGGLC